MTSSEAPRLGPSVVGVSATAERTPGVARTSASAAAGSPGPLLVSASSPDSAACRSWVTAWSIVVLLNSIVQLMATESTSGVLADEKRRVAAPTFADARNPPTGASAASGGPTSLATTRATIGPRKPAASTSMIAVITDVAAAVSGTLVVVDTRNSGTAPARASSPPMTRPGPSRPGSTVALVSATVGRTRAARRPAARTASSATATPPPIAAAAGIQPASTVKFAGTMPWRTSACAELLAEHGAGPDSGRRPDQADDRRLPRDHAADLARRRGHRSQQRDLALALLDRQPHRARHDEHRDEHREAAERRRDRDQGGPRLRGARDARPGRVRRR